MTQFDLAYPDLPIEALVRTQEHVFQRAFAQQVLRIIGQPPTGVAYEAGHDGLHIYARDEMALERALAAAKPHVGSAASIDAPRIRYRVGKRIEEPVMDLVVQAPQAYADTVQEELQQRAANVIDVSAVPELVIVRGRAALHGLMGYPAWLHQATDGEATLSMWLSHYQPVSGGQGPEAA